MKGRFEEIKGRDPDFEVTWPDLARGEENQIGDDHEEEDDYSY